MRERPRDKARLEHILKACDVIIDAQSRYDFKTIAADPLLYHGLVKHIEIIGEAVYMLTKEFKEQNPVAERKTIEGMRHILVHDYYRITSDLIREVVENDIPALRPVIQGLYYKESLQ